VKAQIEDLDTAVKILRSGRKAIVLTPEATAAVSAWLVWLKAAGAISGTLFRAVWRSSHLGGPLTEDGMYASLRARATKAGVKGFTLRALHPQQGEGNEEGAG
jgi:hypothetical protein